MWGGPSFIDQDETFRRVLAITERKSFDAAPVEAQRDNSPWLTAPALALIGIRKVVKRSQYAAHEGVNTGGLNGCYWIRVVKTLANGDLVVENLHDVGKIKLERVQATIEPDLVYPLLRGRDVERWRVESSSFIVAPQDRVKQREGIPEGEMRRKYPKTFAYLKKFEKQLTARRDRKYYPEGSSFYTMRNMAAYSLAPWKVLWPEVGHTVRAGVCGPMQVGSKKPVLPDHTIVAVSCETKDEAHFICALLNSSAAQCAASRYIVLHPSPHIMEHIAIPAFSPNEAKAPPSVRPVGSLSYRYCQGRPETNNCPGGRNRQSRCEALGHHGR